MRAHDAHTFSNISADTAEFALTGGVYVVDAVATWGGGSITLERLGPDGTTWLTAVTALTANGVSAASALPPGQYRVAVATATAVYVTVVRVPGE